MEAKVGSYKKNTNVVYLHLRTKFYEEFMDLLMMGGVWLIR